MWVPLPALRLLTASCAPGLGTVQGISQDAVGQCPFSPLSLNYACPQTQRLPLLQEMALTTPDLSLAFTLKPIDCVLDPGVLNCLNTAPPPLCLHGGDTEPTPISGGGPQLL